MNHQHKCSFKFPPAIAALLCLALLPAALAQTAPSLGAASTFAVLGGSNVTCTGPGVITGDVGVSTGVFTSTTGCVVVGTVHQHDSAASVAHNAFDNAYSNALASNPVCNQTLTAAPGASFTLPPGVYCSVAALTFTTVTLTLDAGGNANAVWIFKIPAALTGNNFQVVMAGGAQPCNVFWLVGSDSTLTTSTFQGNILAGGTTGSFTSTGGALIGRVLANGAVTMTGPNVHGTCAISASGGGGGCDVDDGDRDRHHKDKSKDRDRDKDKHKDRDHDNNNDHHDD
jgi:hypothetical protein